MRALLSTVAIALAACASSTPHAGRSPAFASAVVTPSSSATAATPPIASSAAPAVAPSAPPTPFTLAAVGDIMLARTLATRADSSPFVNVASVLGAADLAVGNLECAVGTGGVPAHKALTFLAPPAAASTLAAAGFDLVTLANNHALDFGPDVLAQTTSLLDGVRIAHTGAGATEADAHRPAVIDVHGTRVAFLGYVKVIAEGAGGKGFDTRTWEAHGDAPGVAWADPDRIALDVARARLEADVVVVMLHTGFESHAIPNLWQRAAAHAAVDAGALVVLGAHPHVLQGIERYKGGFIAYSLGDFVFDGADKYSAILQLTLERDAVRDVAWTPVRLRAGVPTLVSPSERIGVEHLIASLSRELTYRWSEQ